MKRILLIPVFAIVVGGVFAADMVGDYNTWLGYIAGINAEGDRTTLQGAGAGGEAQSIVRTTLVGAAAGTYTKGLTDCVGIGYRALRNAQDMEGVVAIGRDAFADKSNLKDATWINGHVVIDEGGFYIAPDRSYHVITGSKDGSDVSIIAKAQINILAGDAVKLRAGKTDLDLVDLISDLNSLKSFKSAAEAKIEDLTSVLIAATNRIAQLEAKVGN